MKHIKLVILFLFFSIVVPERLVQPEEQLVTVLVALNHTDWKYKIGEKAKFKFSVYQFGHLLRGANIRYEIGPERMAPFKSGSLSANHGEVVIDGGSMAFPGFLRCIIYADVDGKTYRGIATA